MLKLADVMPAWAWPALFLAAGALGVLVTELALPPRRRQVEMACLTLAAVALIASVTAAGLVPADGLTRLVYTLVGLAAAGALALVRPQLDAGEPAAFVALLLLAAAGMGLLAAARSLPLLFVGLELLSLSLYVMAAYRREDVRSREGAFKYFLLGSAASGLLLFGAALVYGSTGSLGLPAGPVEVPPAARPVLAAGFILVLVGLAFKLALAPFHFWAPDAYEGGMLGVTAFMSVATKAAAFAALVRVARAAPPEAVAVLGFLAAASMLVGSLGALRQRDFRRLMAYSGIANAGYLLVGLPAASTEGLAAGAFYLIAYTFMNLGLFAVAALVEPPSAPGSGPLNRVSLDRFEQLVGRSPWAAWLAAWFLAGLTGLPLTGGFVGKVLLIRSAVGGLAEGLALVLVVSSTILAYPYWKLAYGMLRSAGQPAAADPAPGTPVAADPAAGAALAAPANFSAPGLPGAHGRVWVVAGLCAAATLLCGLVPQPLVELTSRLLPAAFGPLNMP